MTQNFTAQLKKADAAGTWTYLAVPFDVEKAYETRSRVPVKGEIDGCTFHSGIENAKKPETRTRRIAKAMDMLKEGQRLKG